MFEILWQNDMEEIAGAIHLPGIGISPGLGAGIILGVLIGLQLSLTGTQRYRNRKWEKYVNEKRMDLVYDYTKGSLGHIVCVYSTNYGLRLVRAYLTPPILDVNHYQKYGYCFEKPLAGVFPFRPSISFIRFHKTVFKNSYIINIVNGYDDNVKQEKTFFPVFLMQKQSWWRRLSIKCFNPFGLHPPRMGTWVPAPNRSACEKLASENFVLYSGGKPVLTRINSKGEK